MTMHREGTALALTATGLAHDYGPRPALRGVDLSVTAGEMVAVTGPSGSGKSTLLHAMSGVLRPDEGEVRLGDRVVTAMSEDERSRLRRTGVGMLFQFGQLIEELTLAENVALPLLLERRTRAEAIETGRAWLARVGVADLSGELPTHVSGGQAQRAALARALVSNPGLLFADEPTGALDSRAGEGAMDLISEIADEEGLTVVLVTHDARVAAYADREVVLRDGLLDVDEAAPAR
ncbi:MAG: ABC transporter ATP-binding protein [Janibacter sp.]